MGWYLHDTENLTALWCSIGRTSMGRRSIAAGKVIVSPDQHVAGEFIKTLCKDKFQRFSELKYLSALYLL